MEKVSIKSIKGRIKSVKNIQKLTRAMMLVAAAKLSKAEANIKKARPYSQRLQEIINDIAGRAEKNHPFLATRKQEHELVVIISSERGLCGSFNTNILKEGDNYIKKSEVRSLESGVGESLLLLVGKKASEHFRNETGIIGQYPMPEKEIERVSQDLADIITKGYLAGKFDKVSLVYNEFTSIFRQKPQIFQLIPFIPKEKQKFGSDYIYEPDSVTCLDTIFSLYFRFQIFRILLESLAAEYAARMLAMGNATKNAENLIKELLLTFNQVRQAGITKEITEIVSASEAL